MRDRQISELTNWLFQQQQFMRSSGHEEGLIPNLLISIQRTNHVDCRRALLQESEVKLDNYCNQR